MRRSAIAVPVLLACSVGWPLAASERRSSPPAPPPAVGGACPIPPRDEPLQERVIDAVLGATAPSGVLPLATSAADPTPRPVLRIDLDELPSGPPAEPGVVAEIERAVGLWAACAEANGAEAGRFMELYSDDYFRRVAWVSVSTPEDALLRFDGRGPLTFEDTNGGSWGYGSPVLESAPQSPVGPIWILPDERIAAVVRDAGGRRLVLVFVPDAETDRLMIDEIAEVQNGGGTPARSP